jgi:hypothetical protein
VGDKRVPVVRPENSRDALAPEERRVADDGVESPLVALCGWVREHLRELDRPVEGHALGRRAASEHLSRAFPQDRQVRGTLLR